MVAISLFFIPIELIEKIMELENSATSIEEMQAYGTMVSQMMGNFDIGQGILITIVAYIVGFAASPFGKILYKKWGFKIWPKKVVNNVDMFISDKFVLIREFSPANFEYVERWHMYCSLSHNLAVATLVFFIVSLVQAFVGVIGNPLIWITIAAISLLLFFIFLYNAVIYSIWAQHDLNAAISALGLKAKGKNQS